MALKNNILPFLPGTKVACSLLDHSTLKTWGLKELGWQAAPNRLNSGLLVDVLRTGIGLDFLGYISCSTYHRGEHAFLLRDWRARVQVKDAIPFNAHAWNFDLESLMPANLRFELDEVHGEYLKSYAPRTGRWGRKNTSFVRPTILPDERYLVAFFQCH